LHASGHYSHSFFDNIKLNKYLSIFIIFAYIKINYFKL